MNSVSALASPGSVMALAHLLTPRHCAVGLQVRVNGPEVSGRRPIPRERLRAAGLDAEVDVGIVTVRTAGPRPVAHQSAEALRRAADQSCEEVAYGLGAVTARWTTRPVRFPHTLVLVGELALPDGSVLEVPLTQAAGTRLVGVPREETVPGVVGTAAPAGYRPFGMRLRDGLTVVEHTATGVRAAMRTLPRA